MPLSALSLALNSNMALNLEKQLLFYGQYHKDPINVTIHMIFVPLILATAVTLLTNTPSVLPIPQWLTIPYLPPNLGTITAFLYSSLYVLMEPVAGTMIAPVILGFAALGNSLTTSYGATANMWAVGLHISAWIAQFIGHGKFEGRAPALLDNLVQALFLAPLFVWLEFLFGLGYRPELQARLEAGVEKELAKYRKSKQDNSSKSNGKAE